MEYDSVSSRARTSKAQKIGWLAQSVLQSGMSMVMPQSAVLYAKPLPEVRFLVDAAARRVEPSRSETLLEALALLEARRQSDRANLIGRQVRLQ
jgi:phytoene synthase